MATPYKFPWGLHPLDPMISEEFNRRVKDYDMNPTNSPTNDNPYTGPRTAWVRVFSNGISAADEKNNRINGFVLGGTEGFDESYGFGADKKITIGVDCYGNKHEISATPSDPALGVGSDTPHRPPPSIVSVETEFSGGNNTGFNAACKKTRISWKCYSLEQLEYLTPYFLTPRITVLAEWGWNNFDQSSLVDLSSTETLYKIFKGDAEEIDGRIKRSHGNYDLALGFVVDYGYTMNSFGGFDCYTTITNANYLTEGKAYQNRQDSTTDKADPSGSLKLKDFNEFVFDDMENLVIKNTSSKNKLVQDGTGAGSYSGATNFAAMKAVTPVKTVRDDSGDIVILNTKNKVFKNEDDQWMRMDLVVEIINRFFSISFLDPSNKDTGVKAGELVIDKVPICAHPAIKSTNKNFIIPNQYAPRFIARDVDGPGIESQGRRKLSAVSPSPNGEYFKLFPNILKILKDNQLDDSYDNLLEALSTGGAKTKNGSFPQFKDYSDSGATVKRPAAGYWGYLEDIFVSVKYFKDLVEKNETVLRLIHELLQNISECMCNITQLDIKPDTKGNEKKFIIDHNFSPIADKESADSLPRFVLNATNYAFLKNSSFNVKISPEMMNQIVMQSASKKPLPQGFGTATVDAKTMRYSIFSRGDRLFDRGVYTPKQTEKSNRSDESKSQKFSRLFTEQNPDFYVYTYNPTKKGQSFLEKIVGTGANIPDQVFILTETSPAFMKTILLDMSKEGNIQQKHATLMPGTDFKMEFLGIGGITFLSQFTLDHVPNSYDYTNVVWQIHDVKQKIENKVWTTSITAQARPFVTLKSK